MSRIRNEFDASAALADAVCCNGNCAQAHRCPRYRVANSAPKVRRPPFALDGPYPCGRFRRLLNALVLLLRRRSF